MVKQEERRLATRAAIMAAALTLFGEAGYADTSVDDVAASAKVAKGAVYHHFPNKAALFEAVLETVSAQVLGNVIRSTAGIVDFWEEAEVGLRAFFTACGDPIVSRILLHDGPSVLGWARWRAIDQRNFGGLLRHAFDAGAAQGKIVAVDTKRLTRIVLGAVTEAVINVADQQGSAEDHLEIILPMLRGLMLPPQSRQKPQA